MDGGKSFLTPNQFEAACGRASSKDWRGSIKFGSRSLKKLIKEKVLIQHSSVCGCLICMDCSVDDKSRPPPPVRLFTPYKKRRAKDSLDHLDKVPKKSGGNWWYNQFKWDTITCSRSHVYFGHKPGTGQFFCGHNCQRRRRTGVCSLSSNSHYLPNRNG